jgi:hypothetical protein
VQEFAANFRGELIRPEDEGYDAARAVFNAMTDRRPPDRPLHRSGRRRCCSELRT